MDPAGIGGIVAAFVAIFGSMIMEGGSPTAIISPPAIILVVLGTLGAGLASTMLGDAKLALKDAKTALTKKPTDTDVVGVIVTLAETARREGLLALEDQCREVEDPFLRDGLQLAIDGTDAEDLRELLETRTAAAKRRLAVSSKFFADMGGYSPTIGIIGTVIGLVHVLQNLNNPGKLGHLIAGAFIATLWGVMTANVLWLPIASRIRRVAELEAQHRELVVEGVLSIATGSNPRVVHQRLLSLLPGTSEDETEQEQAA